ncbi:hypothetical protein G6F43_002497 [Rhizopus delemar]|nr:hypothetical protein G6F43_002497 [Rhizopus delemar]
MSTKNQKIPSYLQSANNGRNQTIGKNDEKDQDRLNQRSEEVNTSIDNEAENISIASQKFKTYPQAWISLFLLVLVRTVISVFQYTFSVVPRATEQYFNVSLSAVNWLTNVQCIVYVFVSFFTGWIFEKLGVKRSIIASGFLCALGSAIRCIAVKMEIPSYVLTMVGQVIGGTAAPLALNIMTMFSITWFTERLRATAGMFVASNYGAILVMFVIPSITLNETYIPMVLNLVAGFALIVFIPLLFMPNRPPTPPSIIVESERPPFFVGLKMLFKNLHFWILAPHGYSDKDAGTLNAFAFFAGTLGCSVAGPVLDMTKQYKLFLRLISPMVFFVQTLTFPVSGATTGSLLWQGAQVFGFIFVIVMDAFRDPNGTPANSMSRSLIFEAAIAGVIMLLSFLFNGQMKQSETAKWSKGLSQNVEGYADKITSALPVVATDVAVLLDLSEANESKQSVLETEEVGFSNDTR